MKQPAVMSSDRARELLRGLAVPVGLLLIAAVAMADGIRLIRSATEASPSGPPGWYLCTVAVVLIVTTVFGATHNARNAVPAEAPTARTDRSGLVRVWRALGLMVLYAYALPWVGFTITTGVFAIVYLLWVARYSAVRAIAYGLAMDVVTVVLFDQAGVLLPTGAYGF